MRIQLDDIAPNYSGLYLSLRNSQILEFLNRLLVLLIGCAAIQSSCFATLIIGVPNQEGLLLLSDKLGHNTLEGYSDDFQKVVPLSSNSVLAITGSAFFATGKRSGTNIDWVYHLNCFDLAKSYFATNRPENLNTEHFAECMRAGLSNYFATVPGNDSLQGASGVQFVIFRLGHDKKIRTTLALMLFAQSRDVVNVTPHCQEAVQFRGDPDQILAFGIAELPLELLRGHDPKFDKLRQKPYLARFLNPPSIDKVKLSEARSFARMLMDEARENTVLINPAEDKIGTNLDETILRWP
jgi:hypothetical protein